MRTSPFAPAGTGEVARSNFVVLDAASPAASRASLPLKQRLATWAVNRAGQVFLHQRSMQKDLFPGYWDSSAAGHVGAGEDYDGTAVRELPLPDEGPPTSRTVGTLAAHVAVKRDGAIWIGDANFHKPDPMLSRVVRYDLATHTATVVASNLPAMGQIAVDDRWVYMPMFEKGIWRVAR